MLKALVGFMLLLVRIRAEDGDEDKEDEGDVDEERNEDDGRVAGQIETVGSAQKRKIHGDEKEHPGNANRAMKYQYPKRWHPLRKSTMISILTPGLLPSPSTCPSYNLSQPAQLPLKT